VLQYIAACEADRTLIFYTFGDRKFAKEIKFFTKFLKKKKFAVGDVWKILETFQKGRRLMKKEIKKRIKEETEIPVGYDEEAGVDILYYLMNYDQFFVVDSGAEEHKKSTDGK
jgi:hypothetical protein